MKYSGIGGQAVLEGVMMKNQDTYAIAVRKPDGEISVETREYKSIVKSKKLRNVPILRGIINFIDSMVVGMQTLTYSADFYMDEEALEEPSKMEKTFRKIFKEKFDNIVMGATMVFSVVLAIAIFMMLPYFLSAFCEKFIKSQTIISLIEGILRLAIFIGYIKVISIMEDIKRVFMYHGAEHKCINCIEHGLELNVENVRKSSRQHKRCGTSFLLIIMVITIVFFMFIRADSAILRVVLRLILIPVIAGVSYEFLRMAGRIDNKIIDILSKPGLMLQNLTTREPDDAMIEVGIASVDAVFDWKQYLKDNFPENGEQK